MSAPLSWRFAAAGCSATPRRGRDGGGVPPRRRWSALALSARRSSGAEGFDRDAPIAGIRANVRSALDLFRNTVEAGGAARVSFDRTVKDTLGYAARGLVLDALEKITGLPVAVEGTLRLYPDGIVINRLTVGEDMTVDKLLVRAELQPLLAVLDAWKTDPAAAAELRVDVIRARRVNLNRAHFEGVRRAFDIYRAAPGPIIISKLKLYDLRLDVAPHDPYEGRDAPPARRFLRLAALELARLDSRACRRPRRRRRQGGRTRTRRRRARNGGGVRKHTRRRRAHVNHETHHRGMVHARARIESRVGARRSTRGGPRRRRRRRLPLLPPTLAVPLWIPSRLFARSFPRL